jgi:hypothetical protein
VRHMTGAPLMRPPFLSARLLADGPGRLWLREACGARDVYVLCRFKALPLDSVNAILWSDDPRQGVFEPSDYETRVALVKEEPRFVVATLRAYPVATALAATRNTLDALTKVSIADTQDDPDGLVDPRTPLFRRLIPDSAACGPGSRACAPRLPMGAANLAILAGLVASVLYGAWRLTGRRLAARPLPRPLAGALIAVIAILIVNAAACGALVGPWARYEMRLAWVLPALAVLAWAEARAAARGALADDPGLGHIAVGGWELRE